ncbi:MAG: DUF1549 domain-containing protein [Planctomycetaceae bacterium]|nr:DUF1549 domain-containing protein [Planctomycetaceae bacterium]
MIIDVGWVLAISAGIAPLAVSSDPPDASLAVESLVVEPAELVLHSANRRQQVLITAIDQGGRSIDATRDAEFVVDDPAIASVSRAKVQALKDGSTSLLVRFGGREARVTVRASGASEIRPVHFANDIVPILSKLGCNSGGCHGKASGQNGFKLSVFGFDAEADHTAILKEARGRRVQPSSPERSLILLKPTAQVPHGGGRRMAVGSPDYELLSQWLWQGMPFGRDDAPRVVALRASPVERVMGFQSQQQILATAEFSDGSLRDVTDAAAYTSNSGIAAEVDGHGLVRTGRVPGEAAITVQYMGQVAVVRVLVPRPTTVTEFIKWPATIDIDRLVAAKLHKMQIEPSGVADDATFLRRLFLDTIGTLPKPDEVRAFLADTRDDKRRRAIDAVLAREEYADYWTLQWADILLVNRDKLGDRGAFEFHRWLRDQFARNRPYNEWVRELIVASGRSDEHGPVNFYRAVRTPEQLAESVSQAFLGVRVQCAQCHHHPFEKWSQSDFYGMAGFFNGLERKPVRTASDPITSVPRPNVELVYHAGYRETRMPLTDQPVVTQPLGGFQSSPHAPRADAGPRNVPATVVGDLMTGDPRVRLADWLTAPSNPWFARLVANRLWKHFLGRGLVEPEDDLRSTNPATNEPLLDWLAQQVVENRYDLKAVMRLILNSRVYQLNADPNETNRDDEQNFSHHYVRRLPAEVLLDAISEVTGAPEAFPGRPRGTRAIELWDNRLPSYFLDTFGRSERTSPCECGRSGEPTMAQALHLMNAPEVSAKIAQSSGRVARLLRASPPTADAAMIEELTLVTLGRLPTEKEQRVAQALFASTARRDAAEDYLWTLLNSYDFLFVR